MNKKFIKWNIIKKFTSCSYSVYNYYIEADINRYNISVFKRINEGFLNRYKLEYNKKNYKYICKMIKNIAKGKDND